MKLENFDRIMAGKALIFSMRTKHSAEENSWTFIPMFLEWLYSNGFEITRSRNKNNLLDTRRNK